MKSPSTVVHSHSSHGNHSGGVTIQETVTTQTPSRTRPLALLWALPFLIFLAAPIHGLFIADISYSQRFVIGGGIFALTAIYVAAWLVNDTAPLIATRQNIQSFILTISLLLAAQIYLTVTIHAIGNSGGLYLMSYVASCAVLLAPRHWTVPTISAIFAATLVEIIVFPQETFFSFFTILATSIVSSTSRFAITHGRAKEHQFTHALRLAQEKERHRISADLHDILGHTLTGITIKADLAVRLIDNGSTDAARAHVEELLELSRTALTDVRAVVASERTLDADTEIDEARTLLSTAGVTLTVKRSGTPHARIYSTMAAHVIREGCINALRHSKPHHIIVELTEQSVTVINDGLRSSRYAGALPYRLAVSDSDTALLGGSGLSGLSARTAHVGTLSWWQEKDRWFLRLVFYSEDAHESHGEA
ncbi:sensor histidine kinase [Schaalia sp. lx-100]|uniref:sensor histidine kinase n=1 Tax=Schaalia sp. lx-100 TaxID=2899081 RepID=UPI001E63AF20|nr:histidine kinase [Schaalia sp. lx-100]